MLPVDKVFVLNLDRRTDRWQHVKEQFDACNIPVTRFPAIDGLSPEFQSRYWNNEATKKNLRTPGALACLLSHIAMLECAQLNGCRRIAIFEDDVLLHKDFVAQLSRLAALPAWKLVYLGASQLHWSSVQPSRVPGFYHPHKTCGTWAMLIDSAAYVPILRQYRYFAASADLSLASLFANDPEVFVAQPNLCITDVSDSDIRAAFNPRFYDLCRWNTECYASPRSSTVFGSAKSQCPQSSLSSDEPGESYTPAGQ
jgi:GR25 family glycosyltransferase involved in LPS biosynthesis